MAPRLPHGTRLLVYRRAYRKRAPRVGDIVATVHPFRSDCVLIKRVACVLDDGQCFVVGDNAEHSYDSRRFGAVSPREILGRVVRTY